MNHLIRLLTAVFIFFTTIQISATNKLKLGTSTSLLGGSEKTTLEDVKKGGVKFIEYGISKKLMEASPEECEAVFREVKKNLDEKKLKLWSCHIPFGKQYDISDIEEEHRKIVVGQMTKIILSCHILKPKRLILHPSFEPIKEEEREERMIQSIKSIGELRHQANKIRAVLCIENLPRTCLGRDSGEILRLISDYNDVGACYDVNHLLNEDQIEFAEKVGKKIKTLHISDYDKINERHWIPGQGVTSWGKLYRAILKTGYRGVFMYETINDKERPKHKATVPQLLESYKMILEEAKH